MVRPWLIFALISVSLAGCAGGPPEETRDGATPNKVEKTDGETTPSAANRAALTGGVRELDLEPAEKGTEGSILVEGPPGADCGEGATEPGCEKIYFRITGETRVFREKGGRQVETGSGDLARGQWVRVDHTGYPLAESYPAQTTARTVVILDPASSIAGVFFPQQRPVPIGYPDAKGGGELVVDDNGCLRMKSVAGSPGSVPLWPAAFELDAGSVPMQVLNGNDEVVARVGREVVMGGGGVAQETLQENRVLDEQTKRVIFERCPGPYFLAAPEGMYVSRRR